MKVNISSDVQLIAWCCQHRAVTQANVVPDLCCLMGSLGHNELVQWSIMSHGVGNSHRSVSPKPTTLEEDWKLFVDFSSILCLWFEVQGMRTYNFFDWVSNTDESANWVSIRSVMVCHLLGAKPLSESVLTTLLIEPMINPFHGSHSPWKVLEFECCLEKCLIFQSALKMGNFPWKVLENDFMVLKNIGTRKSYLLVCYLAHLNWEK